MEKRKTKTWEELTFADNFLFCKILESEPELCRQILELLLGIKINRLEVPQSEKTMREFPETKGVRFDVYTRDDDRIFDIEMQTTSSSNLPKRSRYYQSVIDMDNLQRGESYRTLKDSYIIFLCLDDIFGKGLPVYFFENACQQDQSLKLDDRAYKVFFNAEDCDKMESEDMRDFFMFLRGRPAVSQLSKSIGEKVAFAKRNMDWRRFYMTWEQEIKFQRFDAKEEGKIEASRENARNLLKMNLGTNEQIAQACSLPLDEVLALKEELAR